MTNLACENKILIFYKFKLSNGKIFNNCLQILINIMFDIWIIAKFTWFWWWRPKGDISLIIFPNSQLSIWLLLPISIKFLMYTIKIVIETLWMYIVFLICAMLKFLMILEYLIYCCFWYSSNYSINGIWVIIQFDGGVEMNPSIKSLYRKSSVI